MNDEMKVKRLNMTTLENEVVFSDNYLIIENGKNERISIDIDNDGNFRIAFTNKKDCAISINPHSDSCFTVKSRYD